ncbi:hypothetical protein Tco_0487592 [Tanacetum coccineum]
MTGDRSRLKNFVKKFIGTVRFGNDHFGAIMGYGDYVISDSVISRVYYVEGVGHNLFSVRQFCDSDLEVAFRKHSRYVRDTDGVELIKGLLGKFLRSKDETPKHEGLQNLQQKNPANYGTIHVQFDELSEPMTTVQLSTGPAPTFLMPGQISSGLVPNPVPSAPYVPPINKELKILFQPMFDEYLEPLRVKRPVSPAPAVPVPVNSAGTPSSTTIDQDAPSPSHSPSSSALQSLIFQQGVAAKYTSMEDNPLAPVDNDPFVNVFAPEPSSEASSSMDVSSAESTYVTQSIIVSRNRSTDSRLIMSLAIHSRLKLDEYGDVLKNKAKVGGQGISTRRGN